MIQFRTKYTGAVPGHMKSEMNPIKRIAFQQMGVYWHSQFRPKHFTQRGATEYGYKPRAGQRGNERPTFRSSYTGQKLRRFGHTRPLVYTGLSERLSRERKVRSTSKGVRVLLPPGFNRRQSQSDINMREELTTIKHLGSEYNQLVRLFDRIVGRELKASRKTTRS